MGMKLFHAADLHYCPRHLDWVDRAFSFAVDHAIDAGADVAVIAGDSFDASMGIHEPAVSAYLQQVIRLASAMPVLVLQGTLSHDRPGCLDILKGLPTEYPIFVADEPGQVVLMRMPSGIAWRAIDDEIAADAVGLISVLPSLNKAAPEIMANGARAVVEETMAMFAEWNQRARAVGIPTALVTHGTVNGSITESGYAMVSPDWDFDEATLYAAGADAVLMGHIHKQQDWTTREQTIAYPGSIARLVHGDHDPKGILVWDIQPGRPSFEFVETPTRQLLEIEFDGTPDMDELADLAARADADTYVRIRWSVDQEHAHGIDKAAIRTLFSEAGGIKLEGIVNPIQSVRAKGIGRAMTLEEKLGYYAVTTNDEDKLDDLERRLAMLQSTDVDQIVARLIKRDREVKEAA